MDSLRGGDVAEVPGQSTEDKRRCGGLETAEGALQCAAECQSGLCVRTLLRAEARTA